MNSSIKTFQKFCFIIIKIRKFFLNVVFSTLLDIYLSLRFFRRGSDYLSRRHSLQNIEYTVALNKFGGFKEVGTNLWNLAWTLTNIGQGQTLNLEGPPTKIFLDTSIGQNKAGKKQQLWLVISNPIDQNELGEFEFEFEEFGHVSGKLLIFLFILIKYCANP